MDETGKSIKQEQSTESRSFQSEETEAVVEVLKTMDYVNRITTKTMEQYGVTSYQYNVLRILKGAGPKGLPTLELADRMVVHSPGVTRMIDRMGKKDLVTRKRSESDRRVVNCLITQKGLDLLKRMKNPVLKMNKRIVQNLDKDQLNTLVNLLNQMRSNTS
ncbi:MAG: MarR family transcriptional regulator [Balneolaceae bacterium]